jgi:hypothetical protein
MPATIIGNSEWTSRGLVLTAQDAQEQVNGLVNVQVTYVGPASRHDQISREFYQDAPPPIFPSVVSPSELVTNRLYMVSRSVSRANGLTTVQADYVGGLQRSGFNGYFLSESVERGKRATAYNYFGGTVLNSVVVSSFTIINVGTFTAETATMRAPLNYTPGGVLRNTTIGSVFLYDERIKLVEFVRIANTSAAVVPSFTRADLASLSKTQQGNVNFFGVTAQGPSDASFADLWLVDGPDEVKEFGLLSFEKDTPIAYTESSSFVTPTVEVVTLTHRLSR